MNIYIGSIGSAKLFTDIMLFPALVVAYFTGGIGILLLILPSLFIHEAAHILSAYLFGCKISLFKITALGGILETDMENASSDTAQKIAIFAFAPFVNIALYAFLYALGTKSNSLVLLQLAFLNGLISIINILPVYPLDGGNILKLLLRKKYDERITFNILLTINCIIGLILLAIFILSAFIFRQYIWQLPALVFFIMNSIIKARKECSGNKISSVINKDSLLIKKHFVQASKIYIISTATVGEALKLTKENCFNIFVTVDENFNILSEISEKDLISYAVENGINTTLQNVCKTD